MSPPDAPPPPAGNRGRDWSADGLYRPNASGRTEHLLDELVGGRWPGDSMPRLHVEQVVASAVVRHPAVREVIASIVPPSAIRDAHCRATFEAALAADPDAADPLGAVVEELRRRDVNHTVLDLVTDGGGVVFLAAGHWRQAVSDLARLAAGDRVREAAVAALASLDAGASPEQVGERLAGRVAS